MNPKLITWCVVIIVFLIAGFRFYFENKEEIKKTFFKVKNFFKKKEK